MPQTLDIVNVQQQNSELLDGTFTENLSIDWHKK